jgi:hypothetical protein
MASKVCSKCSIEKPASEFAKRYDRPIGLRPWCKECQRKIDAEHRLTDRGKKKYRTQLWRKSNIAISYEEYKQKYNEVEGKCEICQESFSSLCVDHNHETGELRGLLCTPCNLAIEHLKESPNIMNNAIQYIKKYGGRNV